MPALSIIAISPAAPRESFREPALAIAAARAGAAGVLDLEYVSQFEAAQTAFEKLVKHAGNGQAGIRCRSGHLANLGQLTATVAGRSVRSTTVNGTFLLILTASGGRFDAAMLKTDIAEARANGFMPVVEAIDLSEAKLAQSCGAEAVIAKGHEGAGRVGDGTTFVLVQQFVKNLSVPVWAQGGIGLHSAAAVVAAGASGIVLDSQLYLCRDSLISPQARQRLEKMDGSETTVLHGPDGLFRIFAENGSPRLAQLQAALIGHNSYALVHALQANVHAPSVTEGDELWILGQDACFASHLARVGGTVSGAIEAIRASVAQQIEIASKSSVLAENSDLAVSHGTRYPLIQGAMTRVSDNSDFAYEVAKAGGLPFLALSLMRAADIEVLLTETAEKLGKMPWGVGLLGFVPPALRQEQMAVVDKFKPPFALIAGGRPDQAKAMEDAGTKTYLHVPSPLLLKSFIEMGSRRFIFEGKECGGHVGPRSSFVLWQSMIEVMLDAIGPRDNASAFHVLFAGGIHDQMSAAMVATLTAPLTARGIKVGFLVGTAYLFTEEAVRTGAIVNKFQEAALKCNETVLLETGPGHSIRCIDSPYKEIFDNRRVELQGQNKSRDEVREELELMNLGRLRIASKGLGRNGGNQLATIPDEQQWQEGMYMIGQVAALHDKVVTIAQLHHDICVEGQSLLSTREIEQLLDAPAPAQEQEGIAIVGMSCQFPQGNDVETYWSNILGKVDSITEIPKTHFDWQNYFDANPLARDKIISKWGGFLNDVVFDPAAYGIPPSSLDSIDPMQMLILEAARGALHDAGYNERKFPREKTSVILANAGHGPITALYSLRSMLGWKLNELGEDVTDKIKEDLPEWTEDSFAGYLGNVAAGRVANRLDLKGINFSIDAACASSLAALYVGISDLRSKASDVVLLGATDTHNQPGDYLSFSKTHALSPDGKCKTFDATANGIAISEGIAILVLKRLSDAERDGDRIYAVIKGIGGSSDGRDLSLTAPRPAGQMLALHRAYADANISPATVQIVEAHGTGTVAGDKAEVEALTNVFKASGAELQSCAIGSVKTNIGHSKAAAGLASIIKIAKALHHKVLPPTINVTTPSPVCKFSEGPFYVNTESRPWLDTADGQPRRGGVSAFGFGGTNFHAVLEEYVAPCPAEVAPVLEAWPAELFVWKASSREDLLKVMAQTEANVKKLRADFAIETAATSQSRRRLFDLAINLHLKTKDVRNGGAALAIVTSSAEDLELKIAQAREKMQKGDVKFTLPAGIHFNADLKSEKESKSAKNNQVAFLFPGQGSQRVNMLKELSLYFPQILNTVLAADNYLGQAEKTARFKANPLSQYIFPPATLSEERKQEQQQALTNTDIAQPALGVADIAMLNVLHSLALTPDMVAGHSYGEYVALYAGGVFNTSDLLLLSAERGRILAQCAAANPGAMAAVSATAASVTEAIQTMPGVYLANINTPAQTIISGSVEAIEAALASFKTKEIAAKRIPVSAAFHSPLMTGADKELATVLRTVDCHAPAIPVYSNSTAQIYSTDAGTIAEQLSQHALKPVLFVDQLKAMHDAGARLFVEVGPGAVLTGLVEATLNGREFVAVNCERSGKNVLEHFLSTLGQLAVNGASIDLGALFWNRMYSHKEKMRKHLNNSGKQMLYKVNSVAIARLKEDGQIAALVKKAPSTNMQTKNTALLPTNSLSQPLLVETQNKTTKQAAAARPAASSQKQHPADVPNRTNGQPPMETNSRRNGNQPARPDQNVDRVMLEFQQSMLEMTNRFLETQQNVMLAYLQANGRGDGTQLPLQNQAMTGQVSHQTIDSQSSNQAPLTHLKQAQGQTIAAPNAVQYADRNNGNGNGYAGNGSGNGSGNGRGNGYGNDNGNGTYVQAGSNGNGAYSGTNGSNGNGNGSHAVIEAGEDPATHAVQAALATEGGAAAIDAINPEALIESLYEIVGERTGYPRSMLDPTLDLEADLGIDSIKRVEILNNFRKLLPEATQTKLESGIEKLAGTKTLQGIIDWIRTLDQIDDTAIEQGVGAHTIDGEAATTATAALAKLGSAATSSSAAKVAAVGNLEKVARGVVALEELTAVRATTKALPNLTIIVADQQEPAKQVATLLDARGQKSILINRKTMTDEQSINQIISQLKENYGRIGAVINICNLTVDAAQLSGTFLLAKAVEADLRDEAISGNHAAFVNVTYLGGNFAGSDSLGLTAIAQQGGIVGLTKTIAKEWADVHVKVIDMNTSTSTETAAKAIVAELVGDDSIVEVGCFQNKRMGLIVKDASFNTLPISSESALTSSSVVLVTGGARGITAKITLDLARKYKPTLVIVGRLPRPKDVESKVTAGLVSAKDIKAALIEEKRTLGLAVNVREIEQAYQHLLREREVRNNLEALKSAGATVRYYAVDICDPAAFGQLIDSIYETSTIDGIIHGAGIIEDALIKDKTLESFERVYNTKIRGAITLAEKVRFDTLKFMYFFSSVVGRTGNSGQADYVSANEALNKLALHLKSRTEARIASLMWGPWQAGMAPPELEAVFASHGWSMIQPEDGSLCFLEELNRQCPDQVEVMLVGKLAKNAGPGARTTASGQLNAPAGNLVPSGVFLNVATVDETAPTSFALTIDTKAHLYLNDHKFDGIPVMPMAAALEIMLEAARSVYPEKTLVEVSDLDIPAGIVFHNQLKDFVIEVGVDAADENVVAVQLASANPKKMHFRCKVRFASVAVTAPEVFTTALASPVPSKFDAKHLAPSIAPLPEPKDLYGTWLFHGPTFQGISSITSLAADEICGEISGCLPIECVTTTDGSQWSVDPVLLDSAMQLGGIWARHYHDVTALPTGFKQMHLFKPIGLGVATARVYLGAATSTDLTCDLAIYNEEGDLAIVVEGLGGIASKSFNRFASATPVQELAR